MALLALQFGAQPILTRSFTPKSICRSTVVLVQEIVKFAMAAMVLFFTGSWSQSLQSTYAPHLMLYSDAISASHLLCIVALVCVVVLCVLWVDWSVASWWLVAGVPAALYVVQNYCSLVAYQNLPAVTFNVLNQTKTLSAALCCYFVMGRVQSKIQIASLLLLLGSALVLEKVIPLGRKQASPQPVAAEKEEEEEQDEEQKAESLRTHLRGGVLPVLVASFTSGLAGALTQKSLQQQGRNSYLLTMELSTASLLVLLVSLLKSPDGDRLKRDGFWNGWTAKTWLPVATNAAGGVLVGLVTKYSGSVRKGFALILGLFLSGVFQATWSSSEDNDSNNNDNDFVLTREQIVGGTLAAFSLWMHSSFPASSSCGGGR